MYNTPYLITRNVHPYMTTEWKTFLALCSYISDNPVYHVVGDDDEGLHLASTAKVFTVLGHGSPKTELETSILQLFFPSHACQNL